MTVNVPHKKTQSIRLRFLLGNPIIPFLLEVTRVLATRVRPNHIVHLYSWGLTRLPPTSNANYFRYRQSLIYIA